MPGSFEERFGVRVPTEDQQRAGRVWAMRHSNYTIVPQTESTARWTQQQVPGSVLVRWDGTAWVEATKVTVAGRTTCQCHNPPQ